MGLLDEGGGIWQNVIVLFEVTYIQQLDEIYDIFLGHYVFVNEVLSISSGGFINNIYISSVYFYINLLIIVLLLYYISIFGYVLWANIHSGQFMFSVNYGYLGEIEGEYGSSEDYFSYLIGLLLLVFWYYIFTLFLHYIWEPYLQSILVGWIFLICLTWVLPFITLGNFGVGFSSYVRGAGKSTNVGIEVLLDYIAVSVIFIRFFIQNIRFLLIFLAYFELFEFLNVQFYFNNSLQSYTSLFEYKSWSSGGYTLIFFLELLFNLVWIGILYFYYVIHLTILYLVQISIYFLLSFWLFGFLFTSFLLMPLERVFLIKRLYI